MKELLIPIAGVAAFIIVVGAIIPRFSQNSIITKPQTKEITIGSTKITADIADTQAKRTQGLSGKVSLGEGAGMLFIFDQKKVFPSIWMKDMLISIDIIWITDGKVVKIDANVPVPAKGIAESNLKLYYPDKPIDYVLEVNAGFSEKNNIKIGSEVDLTL